MTDLLHSLAGMSGLLGLPWRAVAAGLAIQIVLAVLFLKVEILKKAFLGLNDALLVLEKATQAGTSLVFGYLGGGAAPFAGGGAGADFLVPLPPRPKRHHRTALYA